MSLENKILLCICDVLISHFVVRRRFGTLPNIGLFFGGFESDHPSVERVDISPEYPYPVLSSPLERSRAS